MKGGSSEMKGSAQSFRGLSNGTSCRERRPELRKYDMIRADLGASEIAPQSQKGLYMSQAGFGGGFIPGILSWGEWSLSSHVTTEEVS
jgi:hypothetical protein